MAKQNVDLEICYDLCAQCWFVVISNLGTSENPVHHEV